MLLETLRRAPETDNAPQIVAASTHVKVPVIVGLAKRFVFSCAITPPAIDSQVKVPQERSVVQTILFAVKVLVLVGLAKRFVFSCAITPPAIDSQVKVPQERSVVQTILFAFTIPVKVGPSIGAFRSKAVVVALLFKEVITLVVPISRAPAAVHLTCFVSGSNSTENPSNQSSVATPPMESCRVIANLFSLVFSVDVIRSFRISKVSVPGRTVFVNTVSVSAFSANLSSMLSEKTGHLQ